jgi:hypothetical protein
VADKVKAVPGVGVGGTICGLGAGGSCSFCETAADACACGRNGTSNSVRVSRTNKIAHCLAFIRQAFQILKIEIPSPYNPHGATQYAGQLAIGSSGSVGVGRHASRELDLQSRCKIWLS